MKILLILSSLIFCKVKIILAGEETEITRYFESDTFKTIQNKWQVERKSYENAIALILKQNYGHRGLNLYVQTLSDSLKIAKGFYFSDNVVNVVLLDMRLQNLPYLFAPDVVFALASNYLSVEAKLRKLIINSDYILIRNQSDVVFSVPKQDVQTKSPFSYQQVQDYGKLTVVADDCSLVGQTITSLSADTVNLGHDTFKITNCKFTIEIYSPGVGSPPVIAPYFSKEQSLALENLITNPIRTELMPKLQSAVFSYVNTSAVFGEKLPELRLLQNAVFNQTARYMNILVRNFIKNNQGILQLKPLEFSWNKTCPDGSCRSCAKLSNIILYGLDTAYSAQSGGPYNLGSIKIAETIGFSTMQVRGKFDFENDTTKGEYDFVMELRDVTINVVMESKSSSFALVPTKLDVVGWRRIEFSILDLDTRAYERRVSQSLITAHLINEIPKRLLDQFIKTFGNPYDREEPSLNREDKKQNYDDVITDKSFTTKNDNDNGSEYENDNNIENENVNDYNINDENKNVNENMDNSENNYSENNNEEENENVNENDNYSENVNENENENDNENDSENENTNDNENANENESEHENENNKVNENENESENENENENESEHENENNNVNEYVNENENENESEQANENNIVNEYVNENENENESEHENENNNVNEYVNENENENESEQANENNIVNEYVNKNENENESELENDNSNVYDNVNGNKDENENENDYENEDGYENENENVDANIYHGSIVKLRDLSSYENSKESSAESSNKNSNEYSAEALMTEGMSSESADQLSSESSDYLVRRSEVVPRNLHPSDNEVK